jgi:hypothetical protein
MYQMLRSVISAAAVICFASAATAQITATQIRLTEKHVEGFIAAQKDMSAVVEKMQAAAAADQSNAAFEVELDAVTKKHGFKDFVEYEAVAANISMVMGAIDPQTKAFTDPQTAIKNEIAEVAADQNIPDHERKQLLQQLSEALKAAQPIQFPSNIEIVKRYYEKIDAALG